MITASYSFAFPREIVTQDYSKQESISHQNGETSRLSKIIDVTLSTKKYRELTSDNNFNTINLYVENKAISPGGIYIKVVDKKGNTLCNPHYVGRDSTEMVGSIDWNSGKYIILAKAAEVEGKYKIKVYDR